MVTSGKIAEKLQKYTVSFVFTLLSTALVNYFTNMRVSPLRKENIVRRQASWESSLTGR